MCPSFAVQEDQVADTEEIFLIFWPKSARIQMSALMREL